MKSSRNGFFQSPFSVKDMKKHAVMPLILSDKDFVSLKAAHESAHKD